MFQITTKLMLADLLEAFFNLLMLMSLILWESRDLKLWWRSYGFDWQKKKKKRWMNEEEYFLAVTEKRISLNVDWRWSFQYGNYALLFLTCPFNIDEKFFGNLLYLFFTQKIFMPLTLKAYLWRPISLKPKNYSPQFCLQDFFFFCLSIFANPTAF